MNCKYCNAVGWAGALVIASLVAAVAVSKIMGTIK